jgi:hypothetical protein
MSVIFQRSHDEFYPSVMKLNTMALLFRVRTCVIHDVGELTIKIVDQRKDLPNGEYLGFQ